MNKFFSALLVVMFSLSSHTVFASQGEYWEMTTKTEMEGMPFSMPAQTIKICVDKAQGNDPRKANKDKDCQYTDVKISGKKSSWKVRCEHNGEVSSGSGESTIINEHSMEGTMHMSSQSGGREIHITMKQSGKFIGGSCDTEELARENEARNKKFKQEEKERQEKLCAPSQFRRTADWIYSAHLFVGDKPQCPGRQQLCDAVSRDAPRDAETYTQLVSRSDKGSSIAQACGLNLPAITREVCKTISEKNYGYLAAYCPAEAKKYRETQRRKDCEGRSFTAETRAADVKKCLDGKNDGADEEAPASNAPATKSKSGKSKTDDSQADTAKAGQENSTATNVLEGAKKLKGLLGF